MILKLKCLKFLIHFQKLFKILHFHHNICTKSSHLPLLDRYRPINMSYSFLIRLYATYILKLTSDQINSSMLNFSYSEGMTKGRIWGKLNGLSLLTSTINQRGCTWSTVTKEWKFFTDPFLHKKIHIYNTGEHARLSNFRG